MHRKDRSWIARESSRFQSGQYERLPWAHEAWFMGDQRWAHHFAHISLDDTSKIAFTQSLRHGVEDRQTRMKPGRYLKRYYGDFLTDERIRHWAGQFAATCESLALHWADSPDDIERVYTSGPRSCMSHDGASYDSCEHPCRIYGAGDLAVAYIERGGSITGRALAWPEKQLYSRIYGDSDRLTAALDREGFSRGDLDGARLLRIEDSGCYIMPYIDGAMAASHDGDHLVIDSCGHICAENTHGLSGHEYTCDRCGDGVDRDDTYYIDGADESWCDACAEYTSSCEACDERHHDDHITFHHNTPYCDDCASERLGICGHCHETEHTDDLTFVESHGDDVCPSCLENHFSPCESCQEITSDDTLSPNHDDELVCETCLQAEHDGAPERAPAQIGPIHDERQHGLPLEHVAH